MEGVPEGGGRERGRRREVRGREEEGRRRGEEEEKGGRGTGKSFVETFVET